MSVDDKRDSVKSGAQPLRRGRACLVCRHLKIKCDGKRPVCGPCKRAPKEEPCVFTEIFSRTDLLENTVFRLRSRIAELERRPSKSIGYSHLQCWPPPELSRSDSPFGGSSAASPSSPHSASSTQRPFFGAQEPPPAMIQMLLDYFLPHAVQFGFFLRLDHFKESALLRFGDALRPSPALLSVVYLWGIHLSQSEPLLSSEPVFLKRAQQLCIEISESRHPTHLLHTVQAQVLLSTYMFRNRRCLEAEFHANSAATLVLGYRLHQILSARPPARSPSFTATEPTVFLAPPQSAVEEGERIRAFWAVACLQSSLHMALSSESTSLSILESASKDIDTPWPLEIADYEAELPPTAYHRQQTITAFLTDDPPLASAPSTLHAKAAVLLHRASRLGSKWSPDLQPQALASYTASRAWLDGRISQFRDTLPALYTVYADPASARTLVLAHALTAAAAILLHRPLAASPSPGAALEPAEEKCRRAACALFAALGDTHIPALTTAHPIVGPLCALACGVLADALRTGVRSPGPTPEEASVLSELHTGVETMRLYAPGCPLVQHQLTALQEQYESLG